MPRIARARTVVPGIPLHVIVRGNNRRRLFSYASCFGRYLRDLGRAARKHGCAIHAVVLMTNHVHLVITVPSVEALSACMKATNQRYAVFRNRTRAGSGKVFEERFDAFVIDGEDGLARTTAYVELNPVRAGICEDPGDYRWSTYRLHCGEGDRSLVPAWLWTPSSWWLGLGEDDQARGAEHRAFVAERMAAHVASAAFTRAAVVETRNRPYTLRLERPDRTRACEEMAEITRRSRRSRGSPQKR